MALLCSLSLKLGTEDIVKGVLGAILRNRNQNCRSQNFNFDVRCYEVLFRFRICYDPQLADQAQGWIVADSEISARDILGSGDVHIEKLTLLDIEGAPNGTIFLTAGALNGREQN